MKIFLTIFFIILLILGGSTGCIDTLSHASHVISVTPAPTITQEASPPPLTNTPTATAIPFTEAKPAPSPADTLPPIQNLPLPQNKL